MIKENTNAVEHDPTAFFNIINNPSKFSLFLLRKLPAAFFSGLRMNQCNEQNCTVSIPYRWFTQNPFRSTYFACLAMAAEMSTGALVMAQIYKRNPSASMLITAMESVYHKKATGRTRFICVEGNEIKAAINEAYNSLASQSIKVESKGYNEKKELIAEFWFTWSFKVKQ